jgi:hypothetical protein
MEQFSMKRFKYFVFAFVFFLTASTQGANQKEKYVYESPLDVGLDFQAYKLNYKNYRWDSSTTLENEGYGFNLALEWIPFVTVVGKFATSLGFGFNSISNAPVNGATANLYVFPLYGGLTYRADFLKNQVIVPFISGGIDLGFSTQSSKGGATQAGLRIYEGLYYTTGLELCLNAFDPYSGRELDSRIGINGVYLVVMYMQSDAINKSETVNLSHKEFRAGVRFEI